VEALLEPARLWSAVARRRDAPHAAAALVALALLGGLVVAGATEIGVRHFNVEWHAVAGYPVPVHRGWVQFAMLWASAAALPLLQGLAGGWLLPMYGRPRDWRGGLAVGVVGSLPIYAAAPALVVLPGVLLVCIGFLVSCGWWGSGARLLLGVPAGEAADHVVASIIVSAVALSIVTAGLPLF
jgi:hypothetical protein